MLSAKSEGWTVKCSALHRGGGDGARRRTRPAPSQVTCEVTCARTRRGERDTASDDAHTRVSESVMNHRQQRDTAYMSCAKGLRLALGRHPACLSSPLRSVSAQHRTIFPAQYWAELTRKGHTRVVEPRILIATLMRTNHGKTICGFFSTTLRVRLKLAFRPG